MSLIAVTGSSVPLPAAANDTAQPLMKMVLMHRYELRRLKQISCTQDAGYCL